MARGRARSVRRWLRSPHTWVPEAGPRPRPWRLAGNNLSCVHRADYVTLVAREWRSSAPTSRMSQTTFSQPPEPLTSTPSRIPPPLSAEALGVHLETVRRLRAEIAATTDATRQA